LRCEHFHFLNVLMNHPSLLSLCFPALHCSYLTIYKLMMIPAVRQTIIPSPVSSFDSHFIITFPPILLSLSSCSFSCGCRPISKLEWVRRVQLLMSRLCERQCRPAIAHRSSSCHARQGSLVCEFSRKAGERLSFPCSFCALSAPTTHLSPRKKSMRVRRRQSSSCCTADHVSENKKKKKREIHRILSSCAAGKDMIEKKKDYLRTTAYYPGRSDSTATKCASNHIAIKSYSRNIIQTLCEAWITECLYFHIHVLLSVSYPLSKTNKYLKKTLFLCSCCMRMCVLQRKLTLSFRWKKSNKVSEVKYGIILQQETMSGCLSIIIHDSICLLLCYVMLLCYNKRQWKWLKKKKESKYGSSLITLLIDWIINRCQ
jgi:hypothetical protein